MRAGPGRARLGLAVFALAVAGLFLGLNVVLHPTGFEVQSRYLLPVIAAGPIAAGEMARRGHGGVPDALTRRIVPAAFALAAAVHATAWYVNVRGWNGVRVTPPAGWAAWGAVLAAGLLALLATGALLARSGSLPASAGQSAR